MSYIAFLDVLGTKAAASISTHEYTNAIQAFHNSMKTAATCCSKNCRIYGYSDNAYVEIDTLEDTILFFRLLRKALMDKHLYFCAAVDAGSLKINNNTIKKDSYGYSMIFTSPEAIDVYLEQNCFSGIGISLSSQVVADMKLNKKDSEICESIFQDSFNSSDYKRIVDLSYDKVILEQFQCIISDFIAISVMDKKASRYYLTPILSMIKNLDEEIITENLSDIISLITFKSIDKTFFEHINNKYSIIFEYALLDYVLNICKFKSGLNALNICKTIILQSNIEISELVDNLATIPTEVISNFNKKQLMKIIFNMKQKSEENIEKDLQKNNT